MTTHTLPLPDAPAFHWPAPVKAAAVSAWLAFRPPSPPARPAPIAVDPADVHPDGTALMADCGHPHWPGWQLLAALLLLAQAWALVQLTDIPFTRARFSPAGPRVVRVQNARGGAPRKEEAA